MITSECYLLIIFKGRILVFFSFTYLFFNSVSFIYRLMFAFIAFHLFIIIILFIHLFLRSHIMVFMMDNAYIEICLNRYWQLTGLLWNFICIGRKYSRRVYFIYSYSCIQFPLFINEEIQLSDSFFSTKTRKSFFFPSTKLIPL